MTDQAIDQLVASATRLEKLPEAVIKEIFFQAIARGTIRERWLLSFAESVMLAQGDDFHILWAAAILTIDKYKLLHE